MVEKDTDGWKCSNCGKLIGTLEITIIHEKWCKKYQDTLKESEEETTKWLEEYLKAKQK